MLWQLILPWVLLQKSIL
uniref:Uncharacterized protein n=1 Tax=Anguilla anguilla TaxID=7936 RepID=A0A0E9PBJ2_ANGAN